MNARGAGRRRRAARGGERTRRASPRVRRAAALALLGAVAAGTADGHPQHRPAGAGTEAAADYRVRTARYQAPAVELVDASGRAVRLERLLGGERPVLLQFIFTTCTTICPIMSATFASAQAQLVAAHPDTLLVSISIDPEHDTPARLRAFGERLGAGERWRFLTGRAGDIRRTMRAFDVLYAGDNKMYHQFNTFMRVPGREGWTRIDGTPGTADLVAEYRALLAAP